jgi:hypothetical protein
MQPHILAIFFKKSFIQKDFAFKMTKMTKMPRFCHFPIKNLL